MITDNDPRDAAHGMGLRHVILTLLALAYVLLADYTNTALAGVTCLFFGGYLGYRYLIWFNDDRFTPRRFRTRATWALIGLDPDTEEFDTGPVRTYFSLLLILFAGLVLRPFIGALL